MNKMYVRFQKKKGLNLRLKFHQLVKFTIERIRFKNSMEIDFASCSFLGKTSKRAKKTQLSLPTTETLLAVMTLTPPLTAL